MGHSYVEIKILDHSYLQPENSESQLFRDLYNWLTATYFPKIMGHCYLEQEKTVSQLFRDRKNYDTAI